MLAGVRRGGDGRLRAWFGKSEPKGIPVQQVADMLQAVMAADRTVYTTRVVNRLQNEDKVITADEHFVDKKALPLPAQMFRFGAEKAAEKNKSFSYSLLSLWPVNKQNAPRTDGEKDGLEVRRREQGQELLRRGNARRKEVLHRHLCRPRRLARPASAATTATRKARASDFKLGDVMGGVVIRIPTN